MWFRSAGVLLTFPAQVVRIDAPCLLGDAPLHLETRDGELFLAEPETGVGYTRSRLGDGGTQSAVLVCWHEFVQVGATCTKLAQTRGGTLLDSSSSRLGGVRLSVCLYPVIAPDSALCHGSQEEAPRR